MRSGLGNSYLYNVFAYFFRGFGKPLFASVTGKHKSNFSAAVILEIIRRYDYSVAVVNLVERYARFQLYRAFGIHNLRNSFPLFISALASGAFF